MREYTIAMIAVLWFGLAHLIGDFVFQSQWMASNKSKDLGALTTHVAIYGIVLTLFAIPTLSSWIYAFVISNVVVHWCTDYLTSRLSSRLFMAQFEENPITGFRMKDGFTLHNFFVVIGCDQFLHLATLAITAWIFLT